MSKTKLTLQPDPTFDEMVEIQRPGKGPAPVRFTFKHRTAAELESLSKDDKLAGADLVMACAIGWELEEEFNKENVELFVQNYFGSPGAISRAYFAAYLGARQKN